MSHRDVAVEFYIDDAGEHRWRAVAPNGRIVADSAEGYEHAEDCRAGAIIAGVIDGDAEA